MDLDVRAYSSTGAYIRVAASGLLGGVAGAGLFVSTTTMIERLAASSGTDANTARDDLMKSLGGIPLGRPGWPNEVAELVAFLASDDAAMCTANTYMVEAGSI